MGERLDAVGVPTGPWSRRAAALVLVAVLAGCTTDADPAPVPSRSASPAPSTTVSPSPTPSASALPPVTDAVSLPALMRARVVGSDLRLGRVLARTSDYRRYAVTYRADSLTISGVMNVPAGTGPFPVVVLLHGYIDPEVYVSGQGLRREQDALARNGFVALHVDYRNHAGSSRDPGDEVNLRLGYVKDAIAAVGAVRASDLPFLDGSRVGLLGRSMGGGVTWNTLVAEPELVDAAVVYASVSTDAVDNYERWIRSNDGRQDLAARIEAAHGSPEQNPEFWRGVSARSYLDRVAVPVMVHHGTADDTCPPGWARETVGALRAAGKDVTYHEYPGQGHAFDSGWALSMRRSIDFLRATLQN